MAGALRPLCSPVTRGCCGQNGGSEVIETKHSAGNNVPGWLLRSTPARGASHAGHCTMHAVRCQPTPPGTHAWAMPDNCRLATSHS